MQFDWSSHKLLIQILYEMRRNSLKIIVYVNIYKNESLMCFMCQTSLHPHSLNQLLAKVMLFSALYFGMFLLHIFPLRNARKDIVVRFLLNILQQISIWILINSVVVVFSWIIVGRPMWFGSSGQCKLHCHIAIAIWIWISVYVFSIFNFILLLLTLRFSHPLSCLSTIQPDAPSTGPKSIFYIGRPRAELPGSCLHYYTEPYTECVYSAVLMPFSKIYLMGSLNLTNV